MMKHRGSNTIFMSLLADPPQLEERGLSPAIPLVSELSFETIILMYCH